MRLEFKRELLTSVGAVELIAALDSELSIYYPEPGANHFRLDNDEVADERGVFFVAYLHSRAVACGAVRKIDAGNAEVKRMYVVSDQRGRGVGREMLNALESEARRMGCSHLVLETGDRQRQAMRLYERAGFECIPAFGEYALTPLSVCMKKSL